MPVYIPVIKSTVFDADLSKYALKSELIGASSSVSTFSNKTIEGESNIVSADKLETNIPDTYVGVKSGAPPSTGQALIATSSSEAQWGSLDHNTALLNVGTNTHDQIDLHISENTQTGNPHNLNTQIDTSKVVTPLIESVGDLDITSATQKITIGSNNVFNANTLTNDVVKTANVIINGFTSINEVIDGTGETNLRIDSSTGASVKGIKMSVRNDSFFRVEDKGILGNRKIFDASHADGIQCDSIKGLTANVIDVGGLSIDTNSITADGLANLDINNGGTMSIRTDGGVTVPNASQSNFGSLDCLNLNVDNLNINSVGGKMVMDAKTNDLCISTDGNNNSVSIENPSGNKIADFTSNEKLKIDNIQELTNGSGVSIAGLNMNGFNNDLPQTDPSYNASSVYSAGYINNILSQLSSNLTPKLSVTVATFNNINFTYVLTDGTNSTTIINTVNGNINNLNNEGSIDGYLGIDNYQQLAIGDRVLIKNQTNKKHNGIYDIIDLGANNRPWQMVRSNDFDGSPLHELKVGSYIPYTKEGLFNKGYAWVLIDCGNDPVVVNNTNINQNDDVCFDVLRASDTVVAVNNQTGMVSITPSNIGASAVGHTHPQSDITNLTTDLANKANLSGARFTGTIDVFNSNASMNIINDPNNLGGSAQINLTSGANLSVFSIINTSGTYFSSSQTGDGVLINPDINTRVLIGVGSNNIPQLTISNTSITSNVNLDMSEKNLINVGLINGIVPGNNNISSYRRRMTTSVTVPSAVITDMEFNTLLPGSDNNWLYLGGELICQTSGTYIITAETMWASLSGGVRMSWFDAGDSQNYSKTVDAGFNSSVVQSCAKSLSFIRPFLQNEILVGRLYQDSGISTTWGSVDAGNPITNCDITITRLHD